MLLNAAFFLDISLIETMDTAVASPLAVTGPSNPTDEPLTPKRHSIWRTEDRPTAQKPKEKPKEDPKARLARKLQSIVVEIPMDVTVDLKNIVPRITRKRKAQAEPYLPRVDDASANKQPPQKKYDSILDYLEAKYVQGIGINSEDEEGAGSVYEDDDGWLDDADLEEGVEDQVLATATETKLSGYFVNNGELEVNEVDPKLLIAKPATKKRKKAPVKKKETAEEKAKKAQEELDRATSALKDSIATCKLTRRKMVTIKCPEGKGHGDSVTFMNPHIPDQKLSAEIPANLAADRSFKVTVPNSREPSTWSRAFYNALSDYVTASDALQDGRPTREHRFAPVLDLFPTDVHPPVTDELLQTLLKRGRRNERKRKGPKLNTPQLSHAFESVRYDASQF